MEHLQGLPEDDEEFEQLLGEIPRATSAPPLLEELQVNFFEGVQNLQNVEGEVLPLLITVGREQEATHTRV